MLGRKTLLAFLLSAGVAGALPENPDVRHGNVRIGLPEANLMQILQSSPQAIVNWNGFSIGPAERVLIMQPDAASLLLNRVTGQDPSVLQGLLQANGRVFLLNPNGILFGPGSVVDAAGFMASTLSMSDEDFLSGRFRLTQANQTPLAALVNQGEIRVAEGGFVVLVAPLVQQDGLIVAQSGQVNLGATTQATFSLDGRGLVEFATADGFEPTFSRGGQGGTVLLTQGQMTQLLGQVLRDPQVQDAVTFAPGAEGVLVHSGTTRAAEGAIRLDSSQATYLTPGSTLTTDGVQSGGDIRVLSAGRTASLGNISAQSSQGQGGFVEVSGKHLHLSGSVNVDSQVGRPGQVLLDPGTLNIIDGPPPAGSLDGQIPPGVAAGDGGAVETVSTGAIAAVTGTVTLAALNDINYLGPGPFNAPNTDLVLNAGQDINFSNSGLTAASINFSAARDINFNNIDTVTTQTGDLRLNAGRNVTLSNPVNNQLWNSAGALAVTAGGNLTAGTLHFTGVANNGIALTGAHVNLDNTLVDLDGGAGSVQVQATGGNARLGNGGGGVALSSVLSTSVRATGDVSIDVGTNVLRLATPTSDLSAGQDVKLNALNLNTPGKLNVAATRDILFTAPPGLGFSTAGPPDELTLNAGRDLTIRTTRSIGLSSTNNLTLAAGRNVTLDAPGLQSYQSTAGNLTLRGATITAGSNAFQLVSADTTTVNSTSVLDVSAVTNLQIQGDRVDISSKDTLQPLAAGGHQVLAANRGLTWQATGGLDLSRIVLNSPGSTTAVTAAGNLVVDRINGANATLSGANLTVATVSNLAVNNLTLTTPGVLVEKAPTVTPTNFDTFTATAAQAFGEQAPFRFSVPGSLTATSFTVTGGNDTLQNPVAAASLQNVNGGNVQPVVTDNTGDVYVDGVLFYRGKAPAQPAPAQPAQTGGEIRSRADLDDLQEAEVLASLAQNNLSLGNLESTSQFLSLTARKRTTVLAESLSTPYPAQPFSPTLSTVLGPGLGSSLDMQLARAEVGRAVNTQLLLERQDIWQVRYWRDLLQDAVIWEDSEEE